MRARHRAIPAAQSAGSVGAQTARGRRMCCMRRLDELEEQLRLEARNWKASPDLEARLLEEWGQGFRPAAGLRPGVFRPRNMFLAAAAVAAMMTFFWPKPKPETKTAPVISAAAKPAPVI